MSNIPLKNLADDSVVLKELLFKYLKHWKWFAISIFLCLVISKIYLRYAIPKYKASTTILIKDEESGGVGELSALKDLDVFSGGKSNIDDEIEILKSKSLIEQTIKTGNFNISYIQEGRIKSSELYDNRLLNVVFNTKAEDFYEKDTIITIKYLGANKFELLNEEKETKGVYYFDQPIQSKLGNFKLVKNKLLKNKAKKLTPGDNIIINITSLKKATNYFAEGLKVATLNKQTDVIEVSFVDAVPNKARDFLNSLIQNYNIDAIIDKNVISEKTATFINDRLRIITNELAGVERQAESYKKNNDITDLPTEAELYLQNATKTKNETVVVGTQLKVVDMMMDYMRKNKSNDLIPANIIPEDNSASSLIGEFNNLIIERDRVLKSSTTENPTIIRMDEKINSLRTGISQSLVRLKASLNLKNTDLSKQNLVLDNRISKMPRQEREFRDIFRQQQIKEELYLYLFKKREETAISLAATAPKSKIVDEAYYQDEPVSPKGIIVYGIALLLGILFPFIIIYINDLLDTKVKDKRDIDKLTTIPFLGDVPHSDSNNEIIQAASRTSSAEAIRIIRTNLEFMLSSVSKKKAKTIFVTSTLPGEGKTFIAVNLAGTLAISGKKVLLIGLDIRNPKLTEYINLPNRGFTNYLSGNKNAITDYIINQKGYQHFDILPAGVIPPNPAELLMSDKVNQVFDELKQLYDYIVVDTAPVSLVTDTILIAKNADSFVYVVRAKYLHKDLLAIPQDLYTEGKLPNMSIVLNDTDTINGYGYGYGYGVHLVKKPWYSTIITKFKKK